ncbi:SGNH/GDSL hydrolase family protein [Evansella tamaricis]|uniref:SGNH hydrolase-type esterase domain-containing protein n=1 Tax=Evansella tamaricis TaxID=2069301 RepID=A0ABS6JKC5_9BACI|nr:GDSL-type esterase/lipase family protein [Evansella tamaricis]MBU9714136.1 hypothetical protein [Evansella tamaricis]
MYHWLYYTALGDSISAGVGTYLRSGFVGSYKQKLEQHLRVPVQAQTYAKPKITSSQLVYFLRDPRVRLDIAKSHIITINIGGNDLIQANKQFKRQQDPRIFEQAINTLKQNIQIIIDEIGSIKKSSHFTTPYLIQVIGLYNPYPKLTYSEYWITAINNTLSEMTQTKENTVFVDIHSIFQFNGKGILSFGGIHPNGKGHDIIAHELLTSYLNYVQSNYYQKKS